METLISDNYKEWLREVKTKVATSQINAVIKVNTALIEFYWELGRMIVEKQEETKWGGKLLEQLSIDLKKEFSNLNGFSRTNLYYVKQFYLFFSQKNKFVPQLEGQLKNQFVPQLVGQLSEELES